MLATLARLLRREFQQDRRGHLHEGEVTPYRSDRREPGRRRARRPRWRLGRESRRPESDSSSPNRSQHGETYTSRFWVLGSWFWVLVLGSGFWSFTTHKRSVFEPQNLELMILPNAEPE